MMSLPIPQLSAADYHEFRRICHGLPSTHAEWQFNQCHYHERYQASGREFVSIPISPAEVEDYCEREAFSATTDALYCLAQKKAIAKSSPANMIDRGANCGSGTPVIGPARE
jgi:hypothetical protein